MFREVCAANGLVPDLQPVAVGREEGFVRLSFPPDQTWLGTVVPSIEAELASRFEMDSVEVAMTTLDAYVDGGGPLPDLVKIDTEGNELAVLQGATRTIASSSPLIVFETLPGSERAGQADFFDAAEYDVVSLGSGDVLSREAFRSTPDVNHFARSRVPRRKALPCRP
jgi:FkbM family methyltransferase